MGLSHQFALLLICTSPPPGDLLGARLKSRMVWGTRPPDPCNASPVLDRAPEPKYVEWNCHLVPVNQCADRVVVLTESHFLEQRHRLLDYGRHPIIVYMHLQPVATIHPVIRERTNWSAFLFVKTLKQFGGRQGGWVRHPAILCRIAPIPERCGKS